MRLDFVTLGLNEPPSENLLGSQKVPDFASRFERDAIWKGGLGLPFPIALPLSSKSSHGNAFRVPIKGHAEARGLSGKILIQGDFSPEISCTRGG